MRTVPARYVLLEYRTLLQMNYPVANRAPGGSRSIHTVIYLMALSGAYFVFCGRATLYGASVGGEAGVSRALELLHSETDRVMALIGCCGVAALGRHYLQMPDSI